MDSGYARPEICLYTTRLQDLMTRLENYNLATTISITGDSTTSLWPMIHTALVAHTLQYHHKIFGYDLAANIAEYTNSPWALLEGGNKIDIGQKLKASKLAGYEITINALGKVASRVKNPSSPTKILFFCESIFYTLSISFSDYNLARWTRKDQCTSHTVFSRHSRLFCGPHIQWISHKPEE